MNVSDREERLLATRSGVPSAVLRISFVEFVALTAALMALTALSIDIMLPALPQIGSALGLASENDRQLVIILYMAGFACGQILALFPIILTANPCCSPDWRFLSPAHWERCYRGLSRCFSRRG